MKCRSVAGFHVSTEGYFTESAPLRGDGAHVPQRARNPVGAARARVDAVVAASASGLAGAGQADQAGGRRRRHRADAPAVGHACVGDAADPDRATAVPTVRRCRGLTAAVRKPADTCADYIEHYKAYVQVRSLRASGDLDDYWPHHGQRELERNHAARYAKGKIPSLRRPAPGSRHKANMPRLWVVK